MTALVHEQIEDVAARAPDAPALSLDHGPAVGYAELDRRAQRLADRLTAAGVGRGDRVGVCLERSVDLAVGLLGVLKAGAAYVPLDPAYPAERLAFMLEDSRAAVVLAHAETLDTVPVGAPPLLRVDAASTEGDPARAGSGARGPAGSEDLAYVIYTSGSTGRPKGVMIPHRALSNFVASMRAEPGMTADDILVSVTTVSFDIFGLELYVPLVSGARVVLASRATTGDGSALARLIDGSYATVMQATPATWRLLIDSGWQGRTSLRALCGGEALPPLIAEGVLERCGELWNMFGPTETTIWSTCTRLASARPPISIGHPIANTTVHVLDPDGRAVARGEEGELYIGGLGLAHGYWRRPELTAERFVEHAELGERLYRTGDLVRQRADGAIDYLGRLDDQVKVRGFRIELGEVETTLGRHPAVAAAAVAARRDADGMAELAAYVVPRDGGASGHELRGYLARSLPGHMVPTTITLLDALPLTPNGKLDRRALPEPARERSSEREYVAPRSELERRLVSIWEDVLELAPIGVTDNFFDLGVTSLGSARLFRRLEEDLGDRLPIGAVLQAPTVAELAQLIERGRAGTQWTSLVPVRPRGTRPPLFCLHGGTGRILYAEWLARALGDDQPVYALQARGRFGSARPLHTVEEMARHYLTEVRTVQPHGPYHFAGYCFGAVVAYEMMRQLAQEDEEVPVLIMLAGPSPSWTRQWGWHGNQPSLRPLFEDAIARARRSAPPRTARGRLMRALREPRRLPRPALRAARALGERIGVVAERQLSERQLDARFLDITTRATKAYDEGFHDAGALLIYGAGLYEDPHLGWDGHLLGEIEAHPIPGQHRRNADMLNEPHLTEVCAAVEDYLRRRGGPAHAPAAAEEVPAPR